MGRPAIAFDLETVGCAWDELDEPTRRYLEMRASRRIDREGIPDVKPEDMAREGLGLSPGTGCIVAIALVNMQSDQAAVLHAGSGGWSEPNAEGTRIFRGSEKEMLREFWQLLERFGRVITYNGRGFDLPYACVRSAMHGIRPTRHLLANRYSVHEHCDLAEVLTFFGAAQERFSLDYWCRRFNLTSPKEEGIDGSQVNRLYREGRIDDIAEYCLRDARATGALYRLLEDNLIEMYGRRG